MDSEIRCPRCNSNNTISKGKSFIKSKGYYVRNKKCKNCGRKFRINKIKENDNLKNKIEIKEEYNLKEIEIKDNRIRTLDEIIKQCNVDLSIWNVDRHVINKWEVGIKDEDGHIIVEPLYQVKVWLSKIKPDKKIIPIINPIRFNLPNFNVINNYRDKIKKTIIFGDSQIGFLKNQQTGELEPFHDRKCLNVIYNIIQDIKPDEIILSGDMLDMTEAGKYEKKPEFYFTLQPAINEFGFLLSKLKNMNKNSDIIYLNANHECYDKNTELLTDNGWKQIDRITLNDNIAEYYIENGNIKFTKPNSIIKNIAEEVLCIESGRHKQVVTLDHDVIYKRSKIKAKELLKEKELWEDDFPILCEHNNNGILISDDLIRLLVWTIADGTIVDYKKYNRNSIKIRIQFKLSKERKISRLIKLLDKIGIKYTFKECKKSGINKLQPYYIRIYGEDARLINNLLNGEKTFPEYFRNMNKKQCIALLDEMEVTDGHRNHSIITYWSSKKNELDLLQEIFVRNKYLTRLNIDKRKKYDGSFNNKDKFCLYVYTNKRNDKIKIKKIQYNDYVYCVNINSGAVVTRNNGKIGISGNCRIDKAVKENMLYSLQIKPYGHKNTIYSLRYLLGLDNLKINFIDDYPGGQYFINNELIVKHGEFINLKKELDKSNVSIIQSHLHRIERYSKTFSNGKQITVTSTGCTCRIDGIVPGKVSHPDWQQGLCYVESSENRFNILHIVIIDGKCLFNNKIYEGNDYKNEIKDILNI